MDNSNDMHIHAGVAKNYTIREEQLGGRTHLVVPIIMMTQGVHRGSHGPILHLADELGKFPGAWDGIPVSINHPQEDGQNVSANQPHILDEYVVGRVFNTMMDGQKLKAEAWLDPQLLEKVSPEAMAYIKLGKPLDVSVGVFTDEDMQAGDYGEEHYEAVARNHRPDHLALLPGGTGACSWSDGCGVRVNSKGAADMQTNAIKFGSTESIPWTKPTLADFGKGGNWATMDPADKVDIANHFLIGDDAAANYGELMFPVVNPKSGKLNEQALRAVIGGRGAQANITSAQRISARRQAYRLLNSEFDAKLDVPTTLAADEAVHNEQGLKELARLGLSINGMGYRELSQAIQTKLDRMDDDTKVNFLEDCFDGYIIYRVEPKGPSMDGGNRGDLFKRNYTVAQDGTVEFTGESMPVIKRVSYDPASQTGGMNNMAEKPCCEAKVQMLIESGAYAETDRDRLLTMGEADIDVLAAGVTAKAALQTKIDEMTAEMKTTKDKLATMQANGAQDEGKAAKELQALRESLGDQEKLMTILPAKTKAVISHSLRLYEAERGRKIGHILANTVEGVYTKEVLTAMDDQGLDNLARAIKAPQDYSALAPTPNPNDVSRSPQGYADFAVYPPEVKVG